MIYADFNGSYPLRESVKEYLIKRMDGPFGNPNAIHSLGRDLNNGLKKCRAITAQKFGAQDHQVIFNSGSSEGISQLFDSLLFEKSGVILTSDLEHAAVHEALDFYERQGFQIKKIDVLSNGVVDLSKIKSFLEKNNQEISLACFMAINNETGVIQPYEEIAQACNDHNVSYLCDTTQLMGKLPFDFSESNLQYAICSAHKIGSLPGAGFIMAKNPESLRPFIFGGGQEFGLRGGTQNYLAIETIAVVLNDINLGKKTIDKLHSKQKEFESKILKEVPGSQIIGFKAPRVPGTTLFAIPGIHGQGTQIELESRDIFVTTSSACSDNEPETSKTLKAMNIEDSVGRSVIRISLAYGHEKAYDEIYSTIIKAFNRLSKVRYT